MLRTIALQIMALQRDGLQGRPLFIAHRRGLSTHTVFSLWFCCVSRLYQQGPCSCAKAPLSPPSPPPHPPTRLLLLFACGEFGSWLRGPCARDKNPLHSIRRCPPNTGSHAHAFRFPTRGRCPHVRSHLCREPLWPDRRWSSGTHGNMDDNSTTLRNERKAAGGLSEQIIRLPTQSTIRWWTIATTPFCHNITVKTTPSEY